MSYKRCLACSNFRSWSIIINDYFTEKLNSFSAVMVSEMLTINTMKTCSYSRTASHLLRRNACKSTVSQLKCPISSVCVRKGHWIKHCCSSNTIMTIWQSLGKLENCYLFTSSDCDKKFDKQACYGFVIFARSGWCVSMRGGGDDGMFILAPYWHSCLGSGSGLVSA